MILQASPILFGVDEPVAPTAETPGEITFEVHGEPKAQPRPRAFARRLPNGQVCARVYDAGTAEGWKAAVAQAARPHLPAEPLHGPLAMRVVFRFPRPRGHFGSGRNSDRLKPAAPLHHTCKPDCDNAVKAVLDVGRSIGLWDDDTQVCRLVVEKRYVVNGERPGASVRIAPLTAAERSEQ